jgi:mercuric ion transport protein
MRADGRTKGAIAFLAGGYASALSAAACCGLPVLLASAGIGTAWLLPVARVAGPYADWLALAALALLAASFLLVLRPARVCSPAALCASLPFRAAMIVGLAGGGALLSVAIP